VAHIKVTADPVALRGAVKDCLEMHRILKFLVGSFRLDSILLTQGSILDTRYEISE